MKMSCLFAPTLRETPAEAETESHKLMLRSGMIRKVSAGIYNLLPLGLKVIQNVERIVREEMNRAGAQEVLMPAIIPSELWKESGRWEKYGHLLLRLKDRKDAEYCVGPTHEEVITYMVRSDVRSYRELPLNLYQIQTKFRDEIRPRFGMMRAREFIMKDAYSFHADEESLHKEYLNMRGAYQRIFERCGLNFRIVRADNGDIGGTASEEFMVLADTGEDLILSCECGFASNVEAAEALDAPVNALTPLPPYAVESGKAVEEVRTPGMKSIDEVSGFLKTHHSQAIKTLIYSADNTPVVVLIRGDLDVNEAKLRTALKCGSLELADDSIVKKVTGADTGFAGPIGLLNVKIIADKSITSVKNGVTGANKTDTHLVNISYGRDFIVETVLDLRFAHAGDLCPSCHKHNLSAVRGIEVGHIFKLGTKYSEAMNARFLDASGSPHPFIMGCYGIGVGRTAAAAIEQSNDKDGIVWPIPLAPFKAFITAAKPSEKMQTDAALSIYEALTKAGIETILDDRDERLGVKLKDADLIGFPFKVIAGKMTHEGKVEFKNRRGDINKVETVESVVNEIRERVLQC